jgi:hypothetical protein
MIGFIPTASHCRFNGTAEAIMPWSVTATAGKLWLHAQLTYSEIIIAPSSEEYSLCTCKGINLDFNLPHPSVIECYKKYSVFQWD